MQLARLASAGVGVLRLEVQGASVGTVGDASRTRKFSGAASGSARIGAWIVGIALLFLMWSPNQAHAFNWNECVSPSPLAFSSKTATPTIFAIGGGSNTTADGNTCDLYDYGLQASSGSPADFQTFTVTGNTSGATYTFTYLPCNANYADGPGGGGCLPDGSGSLNTYYQVSVSSTSVTSDSVTVYIDTTPTNTGGNQAVTIPITINQGAATTTAAVSSLNPATFPQTETFTATVTSTSTVSESTVNFKSDGTTISGCGTQPVSNGLATCTTQLASGSHSVVAIFAGDANFKTSTSSTLPQVVNPAVTATQSIASKTLTQNAPTSSFTPVTGGGGTGTLSYSISPTLPTGFSFNTSTGAIAGTPSVAHATSTFTVTVTDTNSQTASNTFQLTVNSAVTATQSIPSATLTQNHAVTSFTPVTGGGGTSPLSYTVSPTLPTGLSINSSTGAISGTASVSLAATTFTVTVTDGNGGTASNTFSLTVNPAVTATQAIGSATLTQNHAITGFTPVTGGGGTGTLTYSITPSPPAGLSFNTANGLVSGTPTVSSPTTTYTVTVTDQNGATASNTFILTVNNSVIATQAISQAVLTQNHAVTSFTPVTATGGTAPLVYTISPTLPAGLSLNSATGAITGTPTVVAAVATFTVTVTDANSATASNTFNLTVTGPVAATQAIASTSLTVNHAATSFTPVTGSGGAGALTYSVAPALPAGLSFNTASGAITGTPTVTHAASSFTVTVTDQNAATATNTFSLAVNAAVTATQAVASTALTQNHATASFTPVTGSGGTPPLTYSVSPTLPAGLSFNTTSGAITGTPTAVSAATLYTVTVTDANNATGTATFSLTVNGAVTATTSVPSSVFPVNQAVASFVPVTGSGGTGSLTYTVSPTLPAGLILNTANGAISGTPTAPSAARSYAVTVTDTLGAFATANFSLAVGTIATQAALRSSVNPSSFGQAVTFTATVTGAGGAPVGNVTFSDGGTAIGTVALASGVAAFSTSTLSIGSHTITASYSGSTTFAPSTSPALAQTVNVPADSLKLRAMQLNVTRTVAQNSGQAISGAIDDAITEGFDAGGAFINPSHSGIRFNFAADRLMSGEDGADENKAGAAPGGNAGASAYSDSSSIRRRQPSARIDDAFAAIDPPRKAPRKFHEDKDWLFWIDVRGSGVDRWATSTTPAGMSLTQSTLHGLQLNTVAGLTYKLTPNFLIGVLGGYETFNYVEQDISGKLTGDGWTIGSYLGWKLNPSLLYDAAVTYSGIGYDGTAGAAQGSFGGHRWMISTGLTGRYAAAGFLIEPSAKVYALWETENAYVDSLGTQQGSHDFGTGRASAGAKASYPFAWSDTILLVPYAGIYGDYYFTADNAAGIAAAGGVPLASTPLLQGWSARLTGGLGARVPGDARIAIGGEYGGFGSNSKTWTANVKAQIPFVAH